MKNIKLAKEITATNQLQSKYLQENTSSSSAAWQSSTKLRNKQNKLK